jgi:hypothetical protein
MLAAFLYLLIALYVSHKTPISSHPHHAMYLFSVVNIIRTWISYFVDKLIELVETFT